jgi:hypothetical protein
MLTNETTNNLLETLHFLWRISAGSVTVEAGDKAKASWVGTYAKNAPHNDQPGAPNNVRAPFGTNYAIAGGCSSGLEIRDTIQTSDVFCLQGFLRHHL